MSVRAKGTALLGALVAAAGCASIEPRAGFDDVRTSVAGRSGQTVHWNTGTPEESETRDAIGALLAEELSSEAAVQVALLNNRDLQSVYEELSIAQADLVRAGLLRNPVFSGELRFATDGGGTGIVLDVAQDFVSLFSMPLRKGRAAAAFEAAKVRVTAEVLDLAFEARTAFYDYQGAEQTREMRQTVLQATAASYDLAKRLRAAGNNRDLDVSNERALYEQSKLDLAAAEAEVVRTREQMNALMGLWGEQTERWHAAVRLPVIPQDEPPLDDLEGRATANSLELALLRREAEIAARSAGIARPFGWLNDGEIGAAAERETDGQWSVGPSVATPVPLFDQGQTAAGEANARYRQAAERTIARAVEIRSRARAAQSALLSARDRARYLERVVLPLRAEIVEQTQLQYNAMQVSAFQLLQAKRDQITAGGDYVDSLREYWYARAALDQILRGRLVSADGSHLHSMSMTNSPGSASEGEH
jgi:outer membrane protein, heavy metal efflux system